MNNKFLGVLLLFGLINLQCFSQAPEIVWEQIYGGNGDDRPRQIINTLDSGLLVVGHSNSIDGDISGSMGLVDYWVVKTDSNGNLEWEKSYGGSGYDYGYSACLGHDGGYVLVGYSASTDGQISSPIGSNDYWVVKINDAGEIEWEKSYGGLQSDLARYVIQTSDGGYAIVGDSKSSDGMVSGHHGTEDESDFWIVKIDISGDLIWENSFGSTEDESANEIIQLFNGDLAVVGKTSGNDGDVMGNYGLYDGWIIRITNDGNLIWSKSIGGPESEDKFSIVETPSGNLILAGSTQGIGGLIESYNGGLYDLWILKLSAYGSIIWSNNFGGSDVDDDAKIKLKDSNRLFISARSQSDDFDLIENKGYSDYWLFEIDTLGALLWQRTFGGSETDLPSSNIISNTGKYFITGYTKSTDYDITTDTFYSSFNYWTLKVDYCNSKSFADIDGDGFGNLYVDTIACNVPFGYVSDSTDCNDLNPDIHPILADICNSIDDNCNGLTDEDAIFVTYYLDTDDDLFGDAFTDSTSCADVTGYVENNLDCNDLNPEINPLMSEICNAIDDNCNIEIDEGLIIYTLYADADGDTYGNLAAAIDTCLEVVTGYVNNNLDCNDTLATIYPGSTELCNYLDDDCDGIADDNLTYLHTYQDADNDNFGNPFLDSLSCELPTGYVSDSTDCDDTNSDIYPGAIEILNGLDDDCDQIADEGLSINELQVEQISLYPNPAFNTIQIISNFSEVGIFTVYTSTGQKVMSGIWDSGQQVISILKLAQGMYLIQLDAEDVNYKCTFIKL